jgi:hypothetical protein
MTNGTRYDNTTTYSDFANTAGVKCLVRNEAFMPLGKCSPGVLTDSNVAFLFSYDSLVLFPFASTSST